MKKLNAKKFNNKEEKVKKLNAKGFTLVELLAIIVILAIILIITIPAVLNVMDNAREDSLVNGVKSFHQWFTKQMGIDATEANDADKVIKAANPNQIFVANTWECISSETAVPGELSVNDYNIGGAITGITNQSISALNSASPAVITKTTCSMIRYNGTTQRYETILVAKENGKFWIAGSTVMWAASDGTLKITQPTP